MADAQRDDDRVFTTGITEIPFKKPEHPKVVCFDLNGVLIFKKYKKFTL